MGRRNDPARRQHAEDKSIIDHLISGPPRPERRRAAARQFSSEDGRELADALRKRWTWNKNGGLPD
jgi:hypothetical protein